MSDTQTEEPKEMSNKETSEEQNPFMLFLKDKGMYVVIGLLVTLLAIFLTWKYYKPFSEAACAPVKPTPAAVANNPLPPVAPPSSFSNKIAK
tara:strand:+ start:1865 stop:2140 length:276 start_codon:yes stop_codon:yes gene_type:complete